MTEPDRPVIHKAKHKDHRCTTCGRRIPRGSNYWSSYGGDIREHTNCLDYESEPVMPVDYNKNRSKYKP